MIKGRRQYRKRRAARRGRRRGQGLRTSIVRVRNSIIPDKMLVKLPYMDYQTVNSVGGNNANYFQKTYSLSSLYDPEPGALNSFPLGYSEYSQLYQSYRVYAASYEISLWNGSDDTSVMGSMYISNQGGTGGANNLITSWMTQPRSRTFTLGNKSGGQSKITLRGKVALPGYAGLTAQQYKVTPETEGIMGSGGSAPSNNVKLFLNLANVNKSVTTALVYATVKIIYHAELYDRATLVATFSETPEDQPDGTEEPVLVPE